MRVQELIEKLNSAKSVCEIECFDAEMAAIDHAIEAIKVLQEIKGTLINDYWHGTHEGAGCARIIQTWIDSLEAK